jgi:hypothetical protein
MSERDLKAKAPRELSAKSREKWLLFTSEYEFSTAELEVLAQSLLAADRAEVFTRKGDHEMALKWSQNAMRWFKHLKFSTGGAVRKPGHPSDTEWSEQRRRSAGGI